MRGSVFSDEDPKSVEMSQQFLQVMANHGLLEPGSNVSYGLPTQRSVAHLFIKHAVYLLNPNARCQDDVVRYMCGPRGSGKSTVMKGMARVIPELVPAIKAVYVDACDPDFGLQGIQGPGRNSLRLPSLGSEVWARMRNDPGISECFDREQADCLDESLASGRSIYLKRDIMPVLQAKGYKLIVAADNLEGYLNSNDPNASWHSDLRFLGKLKSSPCAGILAGMSTNIEDVLQRNWYMRPIMHPKASYAYAYDKLLEHKLPPIDPFNLDTARLVL